jgi:PKD repeat protein
MKQHNNLRKKVIAVLLPALISASAQAQTVDFSITGNSDHCAGVAYTFINNSTGGTQYTWDFGNGNSTITGSGTQTQIYNNPGTYVVTLVQHGSNLQIKKALYVKNPPFAWFYPAQDKVMPGEDVRFENHSSYDITNSWRFGDGKTSTKRSPRHRYSNPGTYNVYLTSHNGCGDSSTYNFGIVVLHPDSIIPEADGYVDRDVACPGQPIHFYSYSKYADYLIWDFGNGEKRETAREEITYTFPNTGIFDVQIIAIRGNYSDTALVHSVHVSETRLDMPWSNVSPWRRVGMYSAVANCVNTPFRLVGGSYSDENYRSWWRLSDGRMLYAQDTAAVFGDTGTYEAWYIYENSCGVKDSTLHELQVLPSNDVSTWSGPYIGMYPNHGNVCPGGTIRFMSWANPGETMSWRINNQYFHNTTTVDYVFPSIDGAYPVWLIRTPECGNPDSTMRMVYTSSRANPATGFNFSNPVAWNSQNCMADTFYFGTDEWNVEYTLNPISHYWDFGDGTTSTDPNPRHKYRSAGHKSVLHITTNQCGISDYTTHTLHLVNNLPPMPRFYVHPNQICAGDSTMFDDFTWDADSTILTFGDGQVMRYGKEHMPHIFHTYQTAGDLQASLVVFNGCASDTGTVMVRVLERPEAIILQNDTTIVNGNSITFRKRSAGAIKHLWSVGNYMENPSTVEEFTWQFNDVGTVKVYLYTENRNECSMADSVTVDVMATGSVVRMPGADGSVVLYPNPTSGAVNLRIQLPEGGSSRITLHDLNGRLMATAFEGKLNAGTNNLSYAAETLQPGVYICRVQVGGQVYSLRLIKQ